MSISSFSIIFIILYLQVEDIESKLDILIDLYKDDRKILLQNHKARSPCNSPNSSTSDSHHPKPRSILIDKQYMSEPSTPIVDKHPKKMMLRNHSDLSSRIRKRVTYKLHSAPFKQKVCTQDEDENKESNEVSERVIEENDLYTIRSDSTDIDPFDINITKPEANNQTGHDASENNYDLQLQDENQNNEVLAETMPVDILLIPDLNIQESLDEENENTPSIAMETSINLIPNHSESNQSNSNCNSDECHINMGHDCASELSEKDKTNQEQFTFSVIPNTDHVVLLPLGSMEALQADSSEV